MTAYETSKNSLISFKNEIKPDDFEPSNSDEEDNEIPYHAREYARPFTYGKLPKGFKKSHLNHVVLKDLPDSTDVAHTPGPVFNSCSVTDYNDIFDNPSWAIRTSPILNSYPCIQDSKKSHTNMYKTESVSVSVLSPNEAVNLYHTNLEEPVVCSAQFKRHTVLPPSPSAQRKLTRPSISPCRPVLRKTPSRQEFEEMLEERRQQSLRDQNLSIKEVQHASIRKDLDELQGKLNKTRVFQSKELATQSKQTPCLEVVKLVETIDLPDETNISNILSTSNEIIESPNQCELSVVAVNITRPETPAFPINSISTLEDRCISPYPMLTSTSPILQRSNLPLSIQSKNSASALSSESFSPVFQQKNKAKRVQETQHDVAPQFVKDSSQFWYKPYMTREEAVATLKEAPPGTFIIRNSTTYKDAFGLVIRVAKPPQGISPPEMEFNNNVLVRHFLIEPTTQGVRLKGCINEPTFTSLSAFVYQHSINPLALPCKLIIPTRDVQISNVDADLIEKQKKLLDQGAACNVLYLFGINTESLTGDEAIRKAIHHMYIKPEQHEPIEVHFKVSQNGITLTDNKRRLFFRRHYASANISHIGLDPENRFFMGLGIDGQSMLNKTLFAFVAKPTSGSKDNQCHLFCDLAPTQPASAIVAFAQKIMNLNLNKKMV